MDCKQFVEHHLKDNSVDLVYADILFDNPDLTWLDLIKPKMKLDGVVYIHTDQRSVLYVLNTAEQFGYQHQSWIIWGYNWGGRPRNKWPAKHEDILFFSVGNTWQWNPKAIGIPKATMIRSTKDWQVPTDVWTDIGIVHTMSREKDEGEHRVWQKPVKLLERILKAHWRKNILVVDPFCGTGTTLVVAKQLGCQYAGCDIDSEAVRITRKRLS